MVRRLVAAAGAALFLGSIFYSWVNNPACEPIGTDINDNGFEVIVYTCGGAR